MPVKPRPPTGGTPMPRRYITQRSHPLHGEDDFRATDGCLLQRENRFRAAGRASSAEGALFGGPMGARAVGEAGLAGREVRALWGIRGFALVGIRNGEVFRQFGGVFGDTWRPTLCRHSTTLIITSFPAFSPNTNQRCGRLCARCCFLRSFSRPAPPPRNTLTTGS